MTVPRIDAHTAENILVTYLNTEMFVKLKLSKRRPKHTRLSHSDQTPDGFEDGGRLLRGRWEEWIPTQNLSELTVKHYTRKLSVLFKFF